MAQAIQAQNVLINNFGLQFVKDLHFFPEWQENLPELTDSEKQQLDRVKTGCTNPLDCPPLLEGAVKMSVAVIVNLMMTPAPDLRDSSGLYCLAR